ncbi:MAG: enoyl-ACP reductase [Betaproteobacteria bacterium]|nr:enoyl-ACP reductase [Betaproteobacteria bacterium]
MPEPAGSFSAIAAPDARSGAPDPGTDAARGAVGAGLLRGKRILVMGVLSNRSIAYGIARACAAQGAELALSYQNARFEKRVTDLASALGTSRVVPCDVSDDAQIAAMVHELAQHWPRLDGLVHAIAYAPREAIAGDFLEGASREAFRVAHDVSAYSLIGVCREAVRLMAGGPASVLTLSYLGAERMVPNYNTMGLAKASLEAGVRYLAGSLGPQGIRVNAISAGPIRTLAASGIRGFSRILEHVARNAPIRRNVDIDDVGKVASFLLSDLSAAMTGEILYVDGGFHWVASGIGGDTD